MALKIRLARAGSKKRPYYHVVIADVRSPRDGRFIEAVGSWSPLLPKEGERIKLDADRIKHWMSHGALPTDRVLRFLDRGRHRQARRPAPTRRRPSPARRRRSASPRSRRRRTMPPQRSRPLPLRPPRKLRPPKPQPSRSRLGIDRKTAGLGPPFSFHAVAEVAQ